MNLIGENVTSARYGIGTITSIDSGYMTIQEKNANRHMNRKRSHFACSPRSRFPLVTFAYGNAYYH